MTYPSGSLNVRVTGRRVVATLIDGLVFGVFNQPIESGSSGFTLRGSLWLTAAGVLYYVLLEGIFGRTVGKFVTGIRVIDAETGRRPGLLSAFVRTLLRLVDGFAGYLVALIVVVNSDRRRRLGDMAAKTLVVRA